MDTNYFTINDDHGEVDSVRMGDEANYVNKALLFISSRENNLSMPSVIGSRGCSLSVV